MSRMTWGAAGERLFSTGVDRGVLYVGDNAVPWNGLVSVEDSPTAQEPHVSHVDGIKVLNASGYEESNIKLSAYYSPEEFDECDGIAEFRPGIYVANQPRREFHLSYRTTIGNDLLGVDYGYKIHLIYNALASPSTITYQTLSDNVEVEALTWDISTRPVVIGGFAATAHFTIDSTKMSSSNVAYFESLLYGTDVSPAQMPTLDAVVEAYAKGYGVALYGVDTYA